MSFTRQESASVQLRSDDLNSLRATISERDATITKLRGEIFLASLNVSTVQIIWSLVLSHSFNLKSIGNWFGVNYIIIKLNCFDKYFLSFCMPCLEHS